MATILIILIAAGCGGLVILGLLVSILFYVLNGNKRQ